MRRDKPQDEIEAANANADAHMEEIIEALMPHESMENGLREDIRRRLVDAFYTGVEFQLERKDD